MVGRVKLALPGAVLAVALLLAPNAAPADTLLDRGTVGGRLNPSSYWLVGLTLDRARNPARIQRESREDDQLFGISATYRRAWLGLNLKLLVTPQRLSPRTRTGLVVGTRFSVRGLGRDWSYGINAQGDATLDDHHWVLYLSPAELGTDLISYKGMRIQLFGGVRYATTGAVITNFLIDPNGHPHAEFAAILDDKLSNPWEGYVSLAFTRRVD